MAEEKNKKETEKEEKVVDTKKATEEEKVVDTKKATEEKDSSKASVKNDSKNKSSKTLDKNEEDKKDSDDEGEPKKEAHKVKKKDHAIARGVNFRASMKNSSYICKFINNKAIDQAISDLEEVKKMKKAVPYRGEIPHRKGKGMMSGRYPIKAAGMFINLLKSLKGNAILNHMDLDKTRIKIASASWASRPMRGGGRKFKRTNVTLIAKEVTKK